jgi:hypothetical protein
MAQTALFDWFGRYSRSNCRFIITEIDEILRFW